ncbi:MAG: tetratricopeptide repeat protein [Bacteroidaceae bacterium]|nr:tetratricopeptide repeat protein [Bacteroidaceae bacterium]
MSRRFLCLALLCASALCAATCAAQSNDGARLEEYVEKADNCFRMGQTELAREFVDYALSIDSADTRALLLKIGICTTLKQLEEALDACIRLKACPGEKPVELYTRWCAIYMQMNNPAAARGIVDEGLRAYPESFALNYSRGHVLMALGEYREGYSCYERVFRMDPLADGPPFLLGMRWDGMGQLAKALFFYLQNLLVKPSGQAAEIIVKQLAWWPSRETLPIETAGDEDFLIFESLRDIHQSHATYGLPYAVLSHSMNVLLRNHPVRDEGYKARSIFEADDAVNETFRLLYADMRCKGLLETFMHNVVSVSDNPQNNLWLSSHEDDIHRLADYVSTIVPLFEKP